MKNYVFTFIALFMLGFFSARSSNKLQQPLITTPSVIPAQKSETTNGSATVTAANIKQNNDETAKDIKSTSKSEDLKKQILDINEDGEVRQKALYALTQLEAAEATKALAEIAGSKLPNFEHLDDPHSAGTYRLRNELALRITALENLDLRSKNQPKTKSYLINIAQNQSHPTLRFLAQLSVDGIVNKKPGKLNRVIEAMIAEKK